MEKVTNSRAAVNKKKEVILWKHPGGKFRRLGPASCTEPELLAIILGSGSKGKSAEIIAQEILYRYGNISDLMGISLKELMEVKGLKEVKATQLAAVFEVTRRILKHIEAK